MNNNVLMINTEFYRGGAAKIARTLFHFGIKCITLMYSR